MRRRSDSDCGRRTPCRARRGGRPSPDGASPDETPCHAASRSPGEGSAGRSSGRPGTEPSSPSSSARPKVVSLDVDAGLRLVGDQVDAGVDEGLARRSPAAWCRPWRTRRPPSTPSCAIFSGYCCEVAPIWPALTACHAGAAAVDRDDRDVLLLAGRLERLVGAGRGGLVDRVDEVDRRVLLQQVLHRRAAALLGAVGHVVADDPRVVLVADLGLVGDVDAEARAGSPGRAGRRPRRRSGSGRAWRSWPACRSASNLRLGPLPDQRGRPGSCRSRRWRRRRSAGRSGVSSAITSMPGLLGLVQRRARSPWSRSA